MCESEHVWRYVYESGVCVCVNGTGWMHECKSEQEHESVCVCERERDFQD